MCDFAGHEMKVLTKTKETFKGFLKQTVERYGLSFIPHSQKVVSLNGKQCMSCKQLHETGNIIVSNGMIKYKCHNRDYEFNLFKITVDPNVHSSLFTQETVNAIFSGQSGTVDLLLSEFISLIKCCDTKSLLIYNGMSKLWESLSLPAGAFVLGHWVRQSLNHHNIKMDKHRSSFDSDSKDYAICTKIMNATQKLIEQTEYISFMKIVASALAGHIYNSNTNSLLSGDPNHFPVTGRNMINLTTGITAERDCTYNFIHECDVKYLGNEYDCVNAKRFMKDLFGDQGSIEYMQQLIGYFLTGKVSDRSFYIFWGKGRNGKSTLINILERIMGKGHYLNTLSDLVFINHGNRSTATPELIPIIGSRLCVVSETKEGETLNTTRIKQLTGDDDIPCRKLYGDSMTFKHSSKFIMITNEPPSFDVDQVAMTDRIKFIPFNARFVSQDKINESLNKKGKPAENKNPEEKEEIVRFILEDPDFIDDLKTKYLDEVFTYFVQGAIKYNKTGILKVPIKHRESYDRYIDSIDDLSIFIKERCDKDKDGNQNFSVGSTEILNGYNEWAIMTNSSRLNFRTMKSKMESKGYPRKRTNRGLEYLGIRLKMAEI